MSTIKEEKKFLSQPTTPRSKYNSSVAPRRELGDSSSDRSDQDRSETSDQDYTSDSDSSYGSSSSSVSSTPRKKDKLHAFEDAAVKIMKTAKQSPPRVEAFLLCYKYLAPSDFDLLTLWLQSFQQACDNKTEKQASANDSENFLEFLRTWARKHPSDLQPAHVSNLLKLLVKYCDKKTSNEFKLIFLQQREDKSKTASLNALVTDMPPKSPKKNVITFPSNSMVEKMFFSLPVKLLAWELTRMEAELFVKITPRELVNQGWQSKPELRLSPNVTRIIERFNEVSYWVATEILKQTSAEAAAQTIKRFISLAKAFEKLHNFNGLMEILGGLNNSSVLRLKKIWELVPEKNRTQFHNLEELMEAKHNFKNYREHYADLEKSKKFKLPCVALLLRDLTFIHVGNSTLTEQGKLNLAKLKLIYEQVKNIQQQQQECAEADFEKIVESEAESSHQREEARIYLMSLPHVHDPDELDEMSNQLEPPLSSSIPGTPNDGSSVTNSPRLGSSTSSVSHNDDTPSENNNNNNNNENNKKKDNNKKDNKSTSGHRRRRSVSDIANNGLQRSRSGLSVVGQKEEVSDSDTTKDKDNKDNNNDNKENSKRTRAKSGSSSGGGGGGSLRGQDSSRQKSPLPSPKYYSGGGSRSESSDVDRSGQSSADDDDFYDISSSSDGEKRPFQTSVLFVTKKELKAKRREAKRHHGGRLKSKRHNATSALIDSDYRKDPDIVSFYAKQRVVVSLPPGITLANFLESVKEKHQTTDKLRGFVYQGPDGGRAESFDDVGFKQFKLNMFESPSGKRRPRIWLIPDGDE